MGDNGAATLLRGDNRNLVVLTFTSTDFGFGSADSIRSGSGNDVVFGGKGGDFINGESGNDVLLGDQGAYTHGSRTPGQVQLLVESSVVYGGDDRILGGGGKDILYGQAGHDILEGGSGHDSLFGGYGNDRLLGQEGNDILMGGPGADFLDGGPGRDTLYVDLFDAWVGGLPEDIIIGGPVQTTGIIFGTVDSLLRFFGLSLTDGAAERFAAAVASREASDAGAADLQLLSSIQYTYQLPSEILHTTPMAHGQSALMWGGLGAAFQVFHRDALGRPTLIGIGDYLESQWGMILLIWGY
jgi:Ca2+-binding RTX toxin-like protein